MEMTRDELLEKLEEYKRLFSSLSVDLEKTHEENSNLKQFIKTII